MQSGDFEFTANSGVAPRIVFKPNPLRGSAKFRS